MPKKKTAAKGRAKAKAGDRYECEVCGTAIVATDRGVESIEDMVCCGKPMKKVPGKRKAKPKARKAGKKKR